jgi:hypothetical protein
MNLKLIIILLLIVSFVFTCCGKSENPKEIELNKGKAYIQYLINSREMQESAKGEDKTLFPSVMADFIFSDIGVSMWPRKDYFPEGEAPRNIPDYPNNINLVHGNPQKPWTVTVIGDDSAGEIIIRGYGDLLDKPLFEEKLPFMPKI